MLIHVKIYWPEAITTMLYPYALKAFAQKLNLLKVNDDEITPMEKFSGTTTDIYLKITTHGDVQFISWMQDFQAIYLY